MKKIFMLSPMVLALVYYGCVASGAVYEEPEENATVIVPAWAPPYADHAHIRYYYLPDIEVYYDVWDQEFVYLHDGVWNYSPSLPPMYAGYDLNSSYVVVLNARVYEPWMHFHYYVAHYPRYYYHAYYNTSDTREYRGFNENGAREIRMGPAEARRVGEVPHATPAPGKVEPPGQEHRTSGVRREPQRVSYEGSDIGKPVKVEKKMMKPRTRDNKRERDREREQKRH